MLYVYTSAIVLEICPSQHAEQAKEFEEGFSSSSIASSLLTGLEIPYIYLVDTVRMQSNNVRIR